jgi:bifunctional non-homologous end joining protein LigD
MIASLAALVSEQEATRMIASSDYFLQAKMDGKRIMVVTSSAGVVQLLNRNGLSTTVPQGTKLPALPPASCLDCEFMHETHTWIGLDMLQWAGEDLTRMSASDRYRWMTRPFRDHAGRLLPGELGLGFGFTPVETAFSLEAKTVLLTRLRLQKAEGLIFRRSNAPYSPGRVNAGGPLFKLPWRKRADFAVIRKPGDDKRAFEVFAYDGSKAVNVGRVTAHGYYDQVPAGTVAVVELEYLYGSKDGRLVQPTILRIRTDKRPDECLISQIVVGGRHAA